MTERYWNAGEVPDALLDWVNENVVAAIPDALLDWVNENVVAAIKDCWEDDEPAGWVEVECGRMVLTVGGPGKPIEDDPAGERDIYSLTFDLLEELTEYSEPYANIGGPCSDAQREDMRERAAALRKLADDIAKLAADAHETANAI